MSSREYIINQIDTLPESILDKVREFIMFQLYSIEVFDNDTDYLQAIPGMTESILEGKAEPLSECLDNVGWDIN